MNQNEGITVNHIRRLAVAALVSLTLSGCATMSSMRPSSYLDDPSVDLKNGFVSLYNGRNLDGWRVQMRGTDPSLPGKVFVPALGGVLHVMKGIPDKADEDTDVIDRWVSHGIMITTRDYSRYIVKFQYKWGSKTMNNFKDWQYDAGAFYHVQNVTRMWPTGIEYQVRYDHTKNRNHTGDLWNISRANMPIRVFIGPDGNFLAPAEGGKPAESRSGGTLAPKGVFYNGLNNEWNQAEVIVMGDRYSIHKLNGRIVNYAENLQLKQGGFGLQGETAEVFYRNILIKPLDRDMPAEQFLNAVGR